MAQVLYRWPQRAHFGKPVPKETIYQHAGVSKKTRQLFIDQVQSIEWTYTLGPETTNLPSADGIEEIQVFTVSCRQELSEEVLRTVDAAVHQPIIFEVSQRVLADVQMQTWAAYKPGDTGGPSKSVKVSQYFRSGWVGEEYARSPLPVAADLGQLYRGLLEPLLPLKPRRTESMSEALERMDAAVKIQRSIEQQKHRMVKAQLKKQLEHRRTLKRLEAELQQLTQADEAEQSLPKPTQPKPAERHP